MEEIQELIKSAIGSAPLDLTDLYYSKSLPDYPDSRIHCLSINEALQYTKSLWRISVVQRMGLWALTDANDSNPFCYIGTGPCCGGIIRFSHDPEPEIYFQNLSNFIEIMRMIGESDHDIDESPKDKDLAFNVQSELTELVIEESDDSVFLTCTYLPVSTMLNSEIKTKLSIHEDFFVREELAKYLIRLPEVDDLEIAERLANDSHPQVQRPGKQARSVINRIKWSR